VYLQGGSSVRFDVSHAKTAFYAACNAIFLHSSGVNEIALLHLLETYSLSVLMYGTPALNLTNRQVSELNACWNNVIRRLFGYHKWESLGAVLLWLGRLNVRHLIQLRKATFYRHLLQSSDVGLLRHNMFLLFLLNNYDDDCILQTLFCSKSDAIKTVWTAFENYVL